MATTATFGFNAANSTLTISIAPASARANGRTHVYGTVAGGVNMILENDRANNLAFCSQIFLSDTGRADVYLPSSTYPFPDSLPNSLTFGCTNSIIFSPAYVRCLTLTSPNAILEGDAILMTKTAFQSIEKRGTGTFFLGTQGAQDINVYTTNVAAWSSRPAECVGRQSCGWRGRVPLRIRAS
jgi:hypothetical protein